MAFFGKDKDDPDEGAFACPYCFELIASRSPRCGECGSELSPEHWRWSRTLRNAENPREAFRKRFLALAVLWPSIAITLLACVGAVWMFWFHIDSEVFWLPVLRWPVGLFLGIVLGALTWAVWFPALGIPAGLVSFVIETVRFTEAKVARRERELMVRLVEHLGPDGFGAVASAIAWPSEAVDQRLKTVAPLRARLAAGAREHRRQFSLYFIEGQVPPPSRRQPRRGSEDALVGGMSAAQIEGERKCRASEALGELSDRTYEEAARILRAYLAEGRPLPALGAPVRQSLLMALWEQADWSSWCKLVRAGWVDAEDVANALGWTAATQPDAFARLVAAFRQRMQDEDLPLPEKELRNVAEEIWEEVGVLVGDTLCQAFGWPRARDEVHEDV